MTDKRQRAIAKRAGRAKARARRKGRQYREHNQIVSEVLRNPGVTLYDVSSMYPASMTEKEKQ